MTAALAAVIVLVAAAGWRATAWQPQAGDGDPAATALLAGMDSAGTVGAGDEAGMSEAERHAARLEVLRAQLQSLQQTPGNLQAFLQALGRLCDSPEACEALLAEALAQYPDRAFAALVESAVARMPFYEREMQSLVMSTELSPRERYQRIHELRQRTLGVAETELAFGQERAWAEYQFRYGELQQQAASLPPAERLSALQSLRASALGAHAAALAAVEGPHGAYERELELMLAGVETEAQRAAITQDLRRKHFDADTVVQMAARDAQLATQQQQLAGYQAEAAQLKAQLEGLRAGMGQAQWDALYEQRMTELRLKHFPAP